MLAQRLISVVNLLPEQRYFVRSRLLIVCTITHVERSPEALGTAVGEPVSEPFIMRPMST